MEADNSEFFTKYSTSKIKPITVSSSGIVGDYECSLYKIDNYKNQRYNCYRCGAPVKPQQHDCEYCGRNIHEN